ncbi:MAG: hypothetical protein ACO2PO_23565 [Candidatus Calescibacterium sp.]
MKRLVEFVGILKIQRNSENSVEFRKFIRIGYERIWYGYGGFRLFIRKFE